MGQSTENTLNTESVDSGCEQSPSNPDRTTTSEATQLPEQSSSATSIMAHQSGDQDVEEVPDYNEQVLWEPDPDLDTDNKVAKLSSTTIKIVEDALSHLLPNERRQGIKRKQPILDTSFTKCPKLDATILSRLPKTVKDADHNMVRLQTLTLDAASPLINLLESARKGTLMAKEAAESDQQAIKLLGNASANMSVERRRRAATHLNPELATLVEDEDVFADAAPILFSKSFDQRVKDHMESIRSLKETSLLATERHSFQRGHPQHLGEMAP